MSIDRICIDRTLNDGGLVIHHITHQARASVWYGTSYLFAQRSILLQGAHNALGTHPECHVVVLQYDRVEVRPEFHRDTHRVNQV